MKLFRWMNADSHPKPPKPSMVGVLMRIFSFSLVGWLEPAALSFLFGPLTPPTQSCCLGAQIIKKDKAYTVLNVFWIGVGVVGMIRAVGFAAH